MIKRYTIALLLAVVGGLGYAGISEHNAWSIGRVLGGSLFAVALFASVTLEPKKKVSGIVLFGTCAAFILLALSLYQELGIMLIYKLLWMTSLGAIYILAVRINCGFSLILQEDEIDQDQPSNNSKT